MEPSGRNRWQPTANGSAQKTAQIGRSATGRNPRQRSGTTEKGSALDRERLDPSSEPTTIRGAVVEQSGRNPAKPPATARRLESPS